MPILQFISIDIYFRFSMKQAPYIEPIIRTIAGGLLSLCAVLIIYLPQWKAYWLGATLFVAINLFQSGFSRFCLMEKGLRQLGLRSEMDEIRALSISDPLTNLPNRTALESEIVKAINLAQRHEHKVAMLFIDLDNFKQVNDIQGHKVGDELLITVANIIKTKLRNYDILARWGGDEFVVILPDIKVAKQVKLVGDKIMQAVNDELKNAEKVNTTLSIGAALFPDDASDMESLLIQADKAMFHAKALGRNNLQVYSEIKAQDIGFLNTDITSRFIEALKEEKLEVFYQPIVDAWSHEITSIEALARWRDSREGWISPGVFIPLAENLGLIEELGKQVLKKSLMEFSNASQYQNIRLSINVSTRQLFSKLFFTSLLNMVEMYNISPERIKLEITESQALETESALNTLLDLSEAGFYISMDDFGTGFSSLSQLHKLPLDELKIDMSFVRRIHTEEGRAMLETIISIGKAMKLNIVAEGIEDLETAKQLRDMGVGHLQGYYFSKPVSARECQMFVSRKSA